MKKTNLLLTMIALLIFSATAAFAQGPGQGTPQEGSCVRTTSKWWQAPHAVRVGQVDVGGNGVPYFLPGNSDYLTFALRVGTYGNGGFIPPTAYQRGLANYIALQLNLNWDDINPPEINNANMVGTARPWIDPAQLPSLTGNYLADLPADAQARLSAGTYTAGDLVMAGRLIFSVKASTAAELANWTLAARIFNGDFASSNSITGCTQPK